MDRFSLELPAWISAIDKKGNKRFFEVKTRNICAGGAYLLTDQLLPVGIDIEMNLILPLDNLAKMVAKRSRIDVTGKVVRAETQGLAVCFDNKYQISPLA